MENQQVKLDFDFDNVKCCQVEIGNHHWNISNEVKKTFNLKSGFSWEDLTMFKKQVESTTVKEGQWVFGRAWLVSGDWLEFDTQKWEWRRIQTLPIPTELL